MRIWRRRGHRHHWALIGYGGAGWWLIGCDCGARELQ